MAQLALLSVLAVSVTNPQIQFEDGSFKVFDAENSESVRLSAKPLPPPKKYLSQKGSKWVCWDERGLTIRVGKAAKTSRLPDIATSPKALSREQIVETVALIKAGTRKREAAALSGVQRLNDTVFLLVRWDQSDGGPWLEALVKVDLNEDSPKPQFVAKLPGLTKARNPINYELLRTPGGLVCVAERGTTWGLAKFDEAKNAMAWTPVGDRLMRYSMQPGGATALFIEQSSYGTKLAGRFHPSTGSKKIYCESRYDLNFVASSPLVVAEQTPQAMVLRAVESGLEQRFALGTQAKSTGLGMLAWSPASAPVRASLLDPNGWKVLANWTATTARASTGRSAGRQ